MKRAYFRRANRKIQYFSRRFPGARMQPNVVCLHTTEGTTWPSYEGGATAPNLTANPVIARKKLAWRQHFALDESSRALVNSAGGVETNTLNVVQVELVGTCDPAHRETWGNLKAGVDYIFWPEAPAWALREVAEFIAFMHKEWGVSLTAPEKWPPYPASYANGGGQRMTGREWLNFYGVCGHMHVPENVHGDPGSINIKAILGHAERRCGGRAARKKVHKTPNADRVFEIADKALATNKSTKRKSRWQAVKDAAARLSSRY